MRPNVCSAIRIRVLLLAALVTGAPAVGLSGQSTACNCTADELMRRLGSNFVPDALFDAALREAPPHARPMMEQARELMVGSQVALGEELREHPVLPGQGRLSFSGVINVVGETCVEHIGTSRETIGVADADGMAAAAGGQLLQLQRELEALTGKSDPMELTEEDFLRFGPALMELVGRLGNVFLAPPDQDAVVHMSSPDALSFFHGQATNGWQLTQAPAGGWPLQSSAALPLRVVGVSPADLVAGRAYPVANLRPSQIVYSSYVGAVDTDGLPLEGVLTVAYAGPEGLSGELRIEEITARSVQGSFVVTGELEIEELQVQPEGEWARTRRTGPVRIEGTFEAPNWFGGALGGRSVISRYERAGEWAGVTAQPAQAWVSPMCETATFNVVSHLPERGRENVNGRAGTIVIRFNESVAFHTIEGRLRVGYLDQVGDSVHVEGRLTAMEGDGVSFEPEHELRAGVIHHVRLAGGMGGVQSGGGAILAEDYSWTFSTVVEPDSIIPVVYQVSANAPLVPGKATLTRVYTMWEPHEDVHPTRNVRSFPAVVRVLHGSGSPIRGYDDEKIRIWRPDLHSEEEQRLAENTVNFFGWYPEVGSRVDGVIAEVEPDDPYPAPEESLFFLGEQSVSLAPGGAPRLRVDYYYLRFGDWEDEVPAAQIQGGHRIAALGSDFITQTFPVVDTWARFGGDLTIPWHVAFGGGPAVMRYLHDQVGARSLGNVVVGFHPSSFAPGGQGNSRYSTRLNLRCGILTVEPFHYPTVRLDIPEDPGAYGVMATVLAHEVGHAFGLSHRPSSCTPDERAEVCSGMLERRDGGIRGFRIARDGRTGWNKSTEEGNGEVRERLLPLMFPCTFYDPAHYFMHDDDYRELLENVGALLRATLLPTRQSLGPAEGPQDPRPIDSRALDVGGPGPSAVSGAGSESAEAFEEDAQEHHVLVSGLLHRDGRTVALHPLHPIPRAWQSSDPAGPYAVVLEDREGRELATLPFGFDAEDEGEWRYFSAVATVQDEVFTVKVRTAQEVLKERRRSDHTPQVGFVAPGPETALAGEVTFRWSASDADGDSLSYTLLYTPGDPEEWRLLAVDHPFDSLLVSTAHLEPGPAPTLKVVVSDGFNMAEATLAITLANPLQPLVAFPSSGETVHPGTDVVVYFNTSIAASQFDADRLLLLDGEGTRVPAEIRFRPDSRSVQLLPSFPLAADAEYTAVLRGGFGDLFGHRMEEDYRWTFRTAEVPER